MEETMMMDAEIEAALNAMSDGTDNCVSTLKLTEVKVLAHLRGNSNLFVPTLNRDSILDTIGMGPIWMALSGGGTFLMGGEEVIIPAVEMRDLSIKTGWIMLNDTKFNDDRFARVALGLAPTDPQVKALRGVANREDIRIHGLVIRLCPWMIRVQAAFEATLCGVKYNWERFHKDYRKDIAEALSKMVEDHVLTTPRAALQAHAAFDPRVGKDEVGLTIGDARRLGLIAGHQQIAGRKVILGRWPAAGEHSFRFVTVVILPDQEDGMIYLNAESWRDLHGGDFDGDLAYVMVDGWEIGAEEREVGTYPKVEILNSAPVVDTLVENFKVLTVNESIDLVMGMLIKKLTGSLTTVFHVLARSAAVNYAGNETFPGETGVKVRKAYAGVFQVFFPVLEGTMDCRKDLAKKAALEKIATCLQHVMNGGAMDTEAFNVFLPEGMDVKFKHMVHLASGMKTNIATLSAVRNTATGRLIAAGSGGRARATERLMENLLRRCMLPEEMLAKLQQDAMGEMFLYVGRKNANNQVSDDLSEEVEKTGTPFIAQGATTVNEVFENIHYMGKKVFEVRSIEEDGHQLSVVVRLTPHWMAPSVQTMRIRVDIPNPILKDGDERKASEDGHMIIQMPNCKPRMYRPRLMNKDGELHMETFAEYLQSILVEALDKVQEITLVTSNNLANRVDALVNNLILESFRDDLQLIQQKTKVNGLKLKQTTSYMILRSQYPLYVPENKDVVIEWAQREELLKMATAAGFDSLSTSKNKPGEVVAKASKFGLPSYLLAVNPFARFLDPKRRPEIREIKNREPLYWKGGDIKLPKVKRVGPALPVAMAEGMREVVCMIADTNLNNFGQDTLLCTEALWENLKLAMFDMEAEDMKEVEQRLNDLKLQGYDVSKLKISPRDERMDGGIVGESYIITVEQEDGIRDAGKIKSCVGPVKGVPSLIPGLRLFANGREIELIVPRETIERKKGLDFWLYMAYETVANAKGEMVEIDPEMSMDDLVLNAKIGLEEVTGNEDGLVDITDQDGNVLGKAFVGAVPFFRPTQTKIGTFRKRGLNNPCQLEVHAAILAGVKLTSNKVAHEKFAGMVKAFRGSQVVNEEVSNRV